MSAQLLKEKNIFIFCLAVRIVEVFYETSSTPLKGKELAWIGDMGIVSISSGLSTLNNRVGIIHILLSSRFTTLHLTLNPNKFLVVPPADREKDFTNFFLILLQFIDFKRMKEKK